MHLVFEPKDLNHKRENCRDDAIQLRKDNQPVPPKCEKHDSPCHLALAALTPFEACAIHASVLFDAANKRSTPFDRPDDHPFSTFERKLLLAFAGVARQHQLEASPGVIVISDDEEGGRKLTLTLTAAGYRN